jgi:hypothetical protein
MEIWIFLISISAENLMLVVSEQGRKVWALRAEVEAQDTISSTGSTLDKHIMKSRTTLLGLLVRTLAAAVLAFLAYSQAQAGPIILFDDRPLAYYRFNDTAPADVATNSGTLGATGNGTYIRVNHRVPGAIVASPNAAAAYDGSGARTIVPYTAALNPSAANPFTVEAWVMPNIELDGRAPLFNEHRDGNRSGWVFFQRVSGTGFNFRMFNQNGSSQSVDITGGSYTVGQWTHLAATWNGTTAILYVNGVAVGSQTAGYVANVDAPFSVGAYSVSSPGDNPFNGAIDEVAFYSTALSAAQLLAHYQNGTNTAPATPYSTLIAGSNPVLYLHLAEPSPTVETAVNLGSLGAVTDGLHLPGLKHQVPGAIVGDSDTAAGYSAIDTNSTDGGVPTIVPWSADLNPAGSFTIEAWLKPTLDGAGNAQSPLFNSNLPENVGWDFYQRSAGTGWNFLVYNGGSAMFDITGGPYTVGQWCHLVAVYNDAVPSATLYLNGVQVAQSTSPNGTYAPNPAYPFGIAGYWDATENPFTGSIDEVALYTNVLTSAQVLAHYQNGTNASRATPYSTLITSHKPALYLRLDEPSRNVAANLGSLGAAANATYASLTNALYGSTTTGVYFSAPNSVAGPQAPTLAGFEADNLAEYSDGATNYIELLNPPGLNFTGQITLEAWIRPDSFPPAFGDIIAHGVNDTGDAEVMMRLNSDGSYSVGSWDGANSYGVSAPAPGGDVGTGNWVHLVGTYDGANWTLYDNGVQLATAPNATGALAVNNANWAIGGRGRWKRATNLDRLFTGAIDEVAIYSHALSAARVAAHYSSGQYGPHPLTLSISGGSVTLTYSAGTLQQADSVSGPYTDVTGAASPYTVQASGPKKFYRLRF